MSLVARSAKSLLVMALLAGLVADGLAQPEDLAARQAWFDAESMGAFIEALLEFDVPDSTRPPEPPAKPEAESGGP